MGWEWVLKCYSHGNPDRFRTRNNRRTDSELEIVVGQIPVVQNQATRHHILVVAQDNACEILLQCSSSNLITNCSLEHFKM